MVHIGTLVHEPHVTGISKLLNSKIGNVLISRPCRDFKHAVTDICSGGLVLPVEDGVRSDHHCEPFNGGPVSG
ncbi:hypothetical protein TUN199_03596 [Pyrenophora tritici-repentis]|nr:hypothetical protein PtrV1_10029 [Pyrenophora tritici-repentis]KAI0577235.1 hypothetical protein Alg130_08462 [Pyrenophora tritici-repentis]KAI0582117.1 hypothetical protein Alg215_04316 [Pyrenophora tritici-repentis]KAI0609493.1 hypothetical protein TUN205_06267 [Pyrenophora tritici-repentis]KAI0624412.1 hypothetical protein TUN199_03596 [Pyrenophora tritici-repentis]